MKAKNMKIQESCLKLRKELEELKDQFGSTMDGELRKLEEEI